MMLFKNYGQARLISDYVDALVVRRRSGADRPVSTRPGDEDMESLIELARTLSAIEIAPPHGLSDRISHQLAERVAGDDAVRVKSLSLTPTSERPLTRTLARLTYQVRQIGRSSLAAIRPLTRRRRSAPWLRQAALMAGFALFGLLVMWYSWPDSTLSAAELLSDTRSSESRLASEPADVVHRVFHIEERTNTGRAIIARRKVDVWQTPAGRLKVRRAYDEAGALIAGEWAKADGTSLIYRPGAKASAERALESPLVGLQEIWRWEPSALHFSRLVADGGTTAVEEQPGQYVLTYHANRLGAHGGVLFTTLTVRKPDLRSTNQTLVVRQGQETREYQVQETAFERLPPQGVLSKVFEPERELLGTPLASGESVAAPLLPPAPAVKESTVAFTDPSDLDRLELDAVYRLHRFGAWLGRRGWVERTNQGTLRIKAIVPGEMRREILLRSLEDLSKNPSVQIDVGAAAQDQSAEAPPADVRSMPAYGTLREYFLHRIGGSSGRAQEPAADVLDGRVQGFARWVLDRSSQRIERVEALQALTARWPASKLRTLNIDAVVAWQSMLQDHALAIQHETDTLTLELQRVFPSMADLVDRRMPPSEPTVPDLLTASDMTDHLATLVHEQHVALQAAFLPCRQGPCQFSDLDRFYASLAELDAVTASFAVPWSIGR